MKVRFHGPIDRVTGSCSQLIDERLNFRAVVDCGMIQGEPDLDDWNRGNFPFKPKDLTDVLLTHAHIDHSGMIPMLYRKGYRGKVWATRETGKLARLLLYDAAKQKGCPYKACDVQQVKFHEPPQVLVGIVPIRTDVFISFFRTSHILGAVAIRIAWGPPPPTAPPPQKHITFSGDLGDTEEDHEQLPLIRFRMDPWESDYAVVESTYGAHSRPLAEQNDQARLDRLRVEIERVIAERSLLVIPAFAVDRTQQLLLDLAELIRRDAHDKRHFSGLRIVLHAGLGGRVSDVYAEAMTRKTAGKNGKVRPYWLSKAIFRRLGLDRHNPDHERAVELYLHEVLSTIPPDRDPQELDLVERLIPAPRRVHVSWEKPGLAPTSGPGILVTGGGMCDGGPILAYLPELLRRTDVTIAFTGYLSGGSLGAKLMDLEERFPAEERQRLSEPLVIEGSPPIEVPKRDVRCRLTKLSGYSGHADQPSLVRWVVSNKRGALSVAGQTIFLNHGRDQARRALKDAIALRAKEMDVGIKVELPSSDRWFDLDEGRWLEPTQTKEQIEREIARLNAVLATLNPSS